MQKVNETRISELLHTISGKRIAVIGDLMLDRYFWGNVNRISPEAPVPIVDTTDESVHLGGAANVASNLKSLGLQVSLCGMIGDDNSGKILKEVAENNLLNHEGIFIQAGRPTTVKTRVIGNNQHIVRLDREVKDKINDEGEKYIINFINTNDFDGIVFEDYNKGVITPIIIREVNAIAKKKDIPVFVDPKFENFFEYRNSTVFKPNRKEASTALNMKLSTKDDVIKAGKKMLKDIACKNVLITLGADGMILFEENGDISQVPTHALHVADVSGAGDTAIATMAAFYCGGATIKESAWLANIASGAVCEHPGIVAITPNELIEKSKAVNI